MIAFKQVDIKFFILLLKIENIYVSIERYSKYKCFSRGTLGQKGDSWTNIPVLIFCINCSKALHNETVPT